MGSLLLADDRASAAIAPTAADGAWLAGFIDAEGSFSIDPNNGGANWQCGLAIALRDDDAGLLLDLQRSTGLGVVRPLSGRAGSKPQASWTIQAKRETVALACILRSHSLRGRKRADAELWCRAVDLWTASERGMSQDDWAQMAELAAELKQVRKYGAQASVSSLPTDHDNLVEYFGGFFTGDGCLLLTDRSARAVMKLRGDDRPILEQFARAFGLGLVRDTGSTPTGTPTAAWRVVAARDLHAVVDLFDRAGLRGRKLRQYEPWRRAALEIGSARLERRAHDAELIAAARSAFAHASAYRPEIDALHPPPDEDDALEAYVRVLREWASTRGFRNLTCTAYDAERRPAWPNRDTIARVFGSWRAALSAADLC